MRGQPRREATCCEPGCSRPITPQSRVRCAEHYELPRYGGHPAVDWDPNASITPLTAAQTGAPPR